MKKITSVIFVFLNLLAIQSFGQQADFYAEVNKNKVEQDELIRLTFTLVNGDANKFTPPELEDFSVISTSQSSQMSVQIIQGKQEVSRTIKKTFLIRPIGLGEKIIGPASLKTDDKTLETDPITIEVVKELKQPSQSPNQPKTQKDYPREDVFLRAFLNKNSIYEGEQALLNYKVYFRPGISNYENPITNFSNFWSKDIQIKNPDVKREIINGMQYRTAVIKKTLLFPQVSGELEIPAAEMNVNVQYGFFDTRRVKLKSNPLKVNVKPLPPGAPATFNGAVGEFSMESDLSSLEAKVNDPITLKLTIKGAGNISLVELPSPNLPDDFEVYDPKVNTYTSTSGNVLSGSKKYEYLLVPRQKGSYKLEPIKFTYFDLQKEEYVTLETEAYDITVTGGTGGESGQGSVTGISKEDVELLGKDIRFIKPEANLAQAGSQYFGSPLYLTLMGLPFLLFALLLLFRKKKKEQAGRHEEIKMKKAATAAIRKIQKLAKSDADDRQYFDGITETLWVYVGDRLQLSRNEQTRDGLRKKLAEWNEDEELAREMEALLDKTQMAVYAPSGPDMSKDAIAEEAKNWIKKMETELKRS